MLLTILSNDASPGVGREPVSSAPEGRQRTIPKQTTMKTSTL